MARAGSPLRSNKGLDRVSTAMKTATATFSATRPTVGDITNGTVVEVTVPAGGTLTTADVVARATGAFIIDLDASAAEPPVQTDPGEFAWTIRESKGVSTLYVWGNAATPQEANIKFWVF